MPPARIVVIGAGVTGLTTALLLSRNTDFKVIVAAKHMPGDYDIEYASPWAGANWEPYASIRSRERFPAHALGSLSHDGTAQARWEADSWPELSRLARNVPEAGLHFQDKYLLVRDKDSETLGKVWQGPQHAVANWISQVAPNYRHLTSPHDLRDGMFDQGRAFTTVCINVPMYLSWLVGQLRAAGVELRRAVLHHIVDAESLAPQSDSPLVVVNCTGLGALQLGGVEDATMYPARGQIVVVRNSLQGKMYSTSGTDGPPDDACYAMERAAGGGTVLGGCYQKGSWDSKPDMELSKRIMERAVKLAPQLTDGKGVQALDVIRHVVGLRPVREGGTRVEREVIEKDGRKVGVVHSYGHGGFGYQSSYGCAAEVVGLVSQTVVEEGQLY